MLVSYAQGSLNIATDIAIYLLPLPTLLSLQVNRKNRGMFGEKPCWGLLFGETPGVSGALTSPRIVALMLVFSVGSVAVIASTVRISALGVFQRSKDKSCEFDPHLRRSNYRCAAR